MASTELSPTAADALEWEAEDEVDQLESDSDIDGTGHNALARRNDSEGQRVPGHTLLPALRLENILKAEGVTGNLALSKEGLFMLSIAAEEFVKKMTTAGYLKATSERRTDVSYKDMSTLIEQYQEFMFLGDTIPAPIALSDALMLQEDRKKELLNDDPALSTSTYRAPVKISARSQGHSRGFNGPSRKNGGNSSSKRERRTEKDDGRFIDGRHAIVTDANRLWVEGAAARASEYHESVQNGRSSAHISSMRPSFVNGCDVSPSRSGVSSPIRNDAADPSPHRQYSSGRSSGFLPPEEPWPSQYTGPASGFLTGPGGPFSHSTANPGRTIYSQQPRSES